MANTEERIELGGPEASARHCLAYTSSGSERALYEWNTQELSLRRVSPEVLTEWEQATAEVRTENPMQVNTPEGPAWALAYRQRGASRAVAVLCPDNGEAPAGMAEQLALVARLALAALQLKTARSQATATRQEQERLVRKERLHAQGQLVRSFAHDFNNLLATILLRAEMTRADCDNAACNECVQIIYEKAGEGARILQQLEDFSGSRPSPDQDLVDLGQLVRTAAEARWADAEAASGSRTPLHLRIEAAEDLHVLASAPDIRDIISHLLNNAREAMPEGGEVCVSVACERKEAIIRISDTGQGMTEQALGQACEPFFSTKAAGHLGLGLSVVHGIVTRSGGRLSLSSRPGTGTEVSLTLPLANLKAVRRELRHKPDDVPELLRNLNVLVVDDEPGVRETVALSLESLGHRVSQAVDGRQAMSLIRYQDGYDALVLDLVMPDVDGWEVAYLARKLQPQAAVVLLTGWGEKVGGNDDGRTDAVLAKPVTIKDLNGTLCRVVAQKRRQRQQPTGTI
ncbi:MAG: ATP-binding protein [Armatimonadia bacterium]